MTTHDPARQPSLERAGVGSNGIAMLFLLLIILAASLFGILALLAGGSPVIVVGLALLLLAFLFIISGFYMLQPNEGAAITLFGAYRGTDRVNGLRWTWPWMGKQKISLRANNLISQQIKVNDLRGNPIEIAA